MWLSQSWVAVQTSLLDRFAQRLNFLPRDMNKVVMVDADAETYTWNPRNTLLVKPYKEHDPKDTTLRSAAKMILGESSLRCVRLRGHTCDSALVPQP